MHTLKTTAPGKMHYNEYKNVYFLASRTMITSSQPGACDNGYLGALQLRLQLGLRPAHA